jgi:hypothetical protein
MFSFGFAGKFIKFLTRRIAAERRIAPWHAKPRRRQIAEP